MDQRLLLGRGLQFAGQPVALGIQFLQLGVQRQGIGPVGDGVDEPLDLPLHLAERRLLAGRRS